MDVISRINSGKPDNNGSTNSQGRMNFTMCSQFLGFWMTHIGSSGIALVPEKILKFTQRNREIIKINKLKPQKEVL